jgi:hypothetical protein
MWLDAASCDLVSGTPCSASILRRSTSSTSVALGATRVDEYAMMNVVGRTLPHHRGRESGFNASRIADVSVDRRAGRRPVALLLHGRASARFVASAKESPSARSRTETGQGRALLLRSQESAKREARKSEARSLQAGTVPVQGRSEQGPGDFERLEPGRSGGTGPAHRSGLLYPDC